MIFTKPDSNTIGKMTASLLPIEGENGNVFRMVRVVTTTLTANTPYRIKYDEYGPFAAAIADGNESNLDETGSAGGVFSRSWQVQNDTPVTGSRTVTVTVTWNDVIGQHTVTGSGILTSDGY